MREYSALAGRIRQALADLDRVVERAEELMDKAQRTGDNGYLDGVALNLHGFYAGVERIFEDIARGWEKVCLLVLIGIEICCCRCRQL